MVLAVYVYYKRLTLLTTVPDISYRVLKSIRSRSKNNPHALVRSNER